MGKSPIFSIIIPCYNCQSTIEETVASVIVQHFESLEIILVDDCSSDETYDVLLKIKTAHNCIKVVRNVSNLGPGGSRNVGLKHASGEYICFLDSDDKYSPDFFSTLYDHIIGTDSDLVLFDFIRCFQNGSIQLFNMTGLFSINTKKREYIALSGESVCMLVAKRGLFENLKFPPTFLAEDVVVVPVLCSLANKITSLHFAGYYYTYTPDSLSRSPSYKMLESLIESSSLLDEYLHGKYAVEFQFRKIRLICYNYIYVAKRLGVRNTKINETMADLMKDCPDWITNPYIKFLPFRKRLFVRLVGKNCFRLISYYVSLQEHFFNLQSVLKWRLW